MLEVLNISKYYGENIILENASYIFKNNGLYTILGRSGEGKSTLLNLMSTLENADNGEIIFDGINLTKLKEKEKRNFRRENLGFIFQTFNLFEEDTVINNIKLVLKSDKENDILIDSILQKLDILELKTKLVKDLSGGEKQRVAIARTLVTNPKIIFADEPTGALDEENSENIFKILKNISKNRLVIMVSHDEESSFTYSDVVLKIENKKIKEVKNLSKEKEVILKEKEEKNTKKLSFLFNFNHFKNTFKGKKIRMSLTLTILSISLLISGLSIFLKNGLGSMLSQAFEGIVGENSLILTRKDDSSSILSYYGASKSDVETILKENPSEISHIGVSYLANFEEIFFDKNEVEILFEYGNYLPLEDYSMSHFNDFTYINSYKNFNSCYPLLEEDLSYDEVVISLSNEDVLKITQYLGIRETFQSLGAYIKQNKPVLLLNLENEIWNYRTEHSFEIKGFVVSREKTIYSTKNLFNENLIENYLQFEGTTNIEDESEVPWALKKVYYFETINDSSSLINDLITRIEYKNYIFDKGKSLYSSFKDEEDLKNRVYCYQSLKETIDFSLIKKFEERFSINSYIYLTDCGYVNYGSIMSGFYKPTFFSLSLEKINEITDLNMKVTNEEFYNLSPPSEVLEGNYLKQGNNIVRFSSKLNKKIEGYYPTNSQEIAISKGMANYFNSLSCLDKNLYITTLRNTISPTKDKLNGDFKTISLKITGIVDEDKLEIYHQSDFSLTLFRDLFNFSSFELNVSGVTFLLNENITQEEVDSINENLKEHKVVSPMSDINKSLDETLFYINIFLIAFSLITIISSVILISIITYINFLEKKKEVAILIMLGFSNKQIIKHFFFSNLLLGIVSFVSSFVSLIFVGFVIQSVVESLFGIPISFVFSYQALLLMIFVLFFILIYSILMLLKPLKCIDLKKELHKY